MQYPRFTSWHKWPDFCTIYRIADLTPINSRDKMLSVGKAIG